jgi:hypothetical protein
VKRTYRTVGVALLIGNAGLTAVDLLLLAISPVRLGFEMLVCAGLVWILWGQRPESESEQ